MPERPRACEARRLLAARDERGGNAGARHREARSLQARDADSTCDEARSRKSDRQVTAFFWREAKRAGIELLRRLRQEPVGHRLLPRLPGTPERNRLQGERPVRALARAEHRGFIRYFAQA